MFCCTVLIVHAAADVMSPPLSQPVANAELNMPWVARVVLPFVMVHDGMSTRESRGIETSSTRDRSAEMCRTIVVSERMPAASPPMEPFSPSRWSEPRISRLTAWPAFGSSGSGSLVGVGTGSTRADTSTFSMLPFSLAATAATPLAPKTTTAATVRAIPRRTPWVRRRRECRAARGR